MSSKNFRNKNIQRPKKSGLARRSRERIHRRRLIELGMTEDQVKHLDTKSLRTLLKKPVQTARMIAKQNG
jgi:hypothetical protein